MPFPYVTEVIQAAILSATSNVLAQGISAYKEDRAFSLNTAPIVQFVTYAILNTPLNCAWQEWLESQFPGSSSPDPASTHPAGPNAYNEKRSDEKPASEQVKDKAVAKRSTINVRNTAIKFALDQTIGATFNTVLFVAGISALKGMGWDEIVHALKNDCMPIYWAGMKLWPLVSLISFTLIPVEKRVVFGSIVGVAWGIFLSLQVAQ
ncbi:hypothetical protein NA57DRAFT_76771 [Rhizodiscina lignyota]|uniref:Uncharacterized protein n=1 Tax=Rhizodiscina lignyota TaxID=1504668 RepID=A0A9P4IE31_9PEZI|nr:hypothetical protein NA57DRAFT_76771 [Rhizodiscina lignyota]